MGYGFQCFTDNGVVQIDEQVLCPMYKGTVPYSTTSPTIACYIDPLNDLIVIDPDIGNPTCIRVNGDGGVIVSGKMMIYTYQSPCSGRLHIYTTKQTGGGNGGIQVFNSLGETVFNSNSSAMMISALSSSNMIAGSNYCGVLVVNRSEFMYHFSSWGARPWTEERTCSYKRVNDSSITYSQEALRPTTESLETYNWTIPGITNDGPHIAVDLTNIR